MKKALSGIGNFLSWIATPLVVMCPLCTFTAAFIALGQVSFLFAVAKVLVPIIIILVTISVFSFFLSYRSHRNRYPLILSLIGGSSLIYANLSTGNVLFQMIGILFLSGAALIDLNLRLNRRQNCAACNGRGLEHSHQI